LQDNENGLLFHRLYTEEYAVNVGRIYKQIIEIDANTLILGIDPNYGIDSLYVNSDYNALMLQGKLTQGSTLYTETYISSGNQ